MWLKNFRKKAVKFLIELFELDCPKARWGEHWHDEELSVQEMEELKELIEEYKKKLKDEGELS